MKKIFIKIIVVLFTIAPILSFAQKKSAGKYPSLFWEITGNGLKKPSYLFGTMHVSSKLVFHLSDSFYYALKNVDAVALELNPDIWQGQMARLANLQQNYTNFVKEGGGDFLTENSFRINKYENELKLAMSTEPTVVNNLLYRSYKAKEDFEEDTFLDLYIYQTGKKLGKRGTGVEDYYETEKIVMEAYTDMAKEKKKKTIDTDGESIYDIQEKTQDAYKRGDLDLMDSLDRMVERSDAFREKFLYKRNEIQANSIDTIMKKSSLFVGVGAAHLPGKRGIIELLRNMGYKLRPIYMVDRDAAQKDVIDKLKVPVNFTTQTADDGFYSVSMPGPLFNLSGEYQQLDRRQFSDMSNGSYYLVTRVKTHAAFLGHSEATVLKKVDSILYENIPGKILSKKIITKNGYQGYDILNKTRTGDLQHYQIFVTPFEVLFFKISGKENYVDGKEAEQFFSSIQLKELPNTTQAFEPSQGGFSIQLPHQPSQYLNKFSRDGADRWEYEALDKTSGNAYMILRKSIHNYNFLDVDTFDLSLMEESFRNDDFFGKQISRKNGNYKGYPYLDVKEKTKDGLDVYVRYLIKGSNYYALVASTKNKKADFSSFFNSLNFTDFKYGAAKNYVDTFLNFTVKTPVVPIIDEELRAKIENSAKEIENSGSYSSYTPYWPKAKNGLFFSDSTGESISVSMQEYPKYYSVKDSLKFFKDEMDGSTESDFIIKITDSVKLNNGVYAYQYKFTDTGSSRVIYKKVFIKDNYFFRILQLTDTLSAKSAFSNSFFNTYQPANKKLGPSIFESNLDVFFKDLFSKDSAVHAKAQQSIGNMYYGEKGVSKLLNAINKLSTTDKDYFDSKAKLITELGYIADTTKPVVVNHLKEIFKQTADTSLFQNEVFTALARHKTAAAYALLKEMILQDPPIFENSYDYGGMFNNFADTLKLAKTLFPELLQLSTLDDYKPEVLSLLVTMVDSGMLKATDYESYFSKIFFDAKIELKKQQGKDEKLMEEESKKDDEKDNDNYNYNRYNNYDRGSSTLDDYEVLLMPQYDKNVNVQKFFEKLLRSKDPQVRMKTAQLLLRNNKPVDDSILNKLAADDKYRSSLFYKLEKIKRLDKFPAKYKTQLALARSSFIADKDYDKIDSVEYLTKKQTEYENKKGFVYFFKYRIKKEDDWKIGLSGLQPINEKEVSSDDDLILLTDKKLKDDEPVEEQLMKQLKKILIAAHPSGKYFYNDSGAYRGGYDYGD